GLIAAEERVRLAGGTFSAGPHRGGFRVRASLPLAAGTGSSAERSATATDARLDPEARDRIRPVRARRRMDVRRAALVPGVCALVLVGVFVVLQYLTVASVGLTPEEFARVHLGDSVHSAEKVLPGSGLEEEGIPTTVDVPTAPAGSSCRFYLARESVIDFGKDVYRICFSDGAVVAADRLRQEEATWAAPAPMMRQECGSSSSTTNRSSVPGSAQSSAPTRTSRSSPRRETVERRWMSWPACGPRWCCSTSVCRASMASPRFRRS